MSCYDSTQSVLKALDLLQAMNQRPVCSVEFLHRTTKLSKPTIIRLLSTMRERGFVARGPDRGTYILTSLVKSLSSGYHREPQLIEAANDVAIQLTKELKWPIGIAVYDNNSMLLKCSTIRYSRISPYHSVINKRYTMLGSALGRAYLAHCKPEDREILVDLLKKNTEPAEAELAHNPAALAQMVEMTRKAGYAVRDPRERPDSYSIAVPIFDDTEVVASMAITWFRSVLSLNSAVERYLRPMREAAKTISERYHSLTVTACSDPA